MVVLCDAEAQGRKAPDVSLLKNEQSGGEILEAMACDTLISEKFSYFFLRKG